MTITYGPHSFTYEHTDARGRTFYVVDYDDITGVLLREEGLTNKWWAVDILGSGRLFVHIACAGAEEADTIYRTLTEVLSNRYVGPPAAPTHTRSTE